MDEHDMMMESVLWPWIDDPSCDMELDASDEDNYCDEHCDESMDGDHESGLASAGWGTDEDYGYFGGDDY